jgi:hypothetical protein
MRRLISGILIGFGTATSLTVYAAWNLLGQVLESKYLVINEAKVISAAETANSHRYHTKDAPRLHGLSIELFSAAIRRPGRIEKDDGNKSG